MRELDWREMFLSLFPGFFEGLAARNLPEEWVYEEMALDLSAFSEDAHVLPVPEGITFGAYHGDMEALRRAVGSVDESWVRYYDRPDRVFCALAGEEPVSFCLVEGMGEYGGLRVGGPGCVGTVPEYRRRGIGLSMVNRATGLLKAQGFDVSWIHYTGVAPWYAKLGYRTVLRWNARGPI